MEWTWRRVLTDTDRSLQLLLHMSAYVSACQWSEFLTADLLDCWLKKKVPILNPHQVVMCIPVCPIEMLQQVTLPLIIKLVMFKKRSFLLNIRLGSKQVPS